MMKRVDQKNYLAKFNPEIESPLADRMRPRDLEEFLGQEHILGKGKALRTLIEMDEVPSMIFWGPPGSGKTTLARIIAHQTQSYFVPISAVASGIADLKRIFKEAAERQKAYGQRTILFIDEIHRFNKAQQDTLLPYVERGTVTLIGATTENPSFEVISPLLSRTRVFVLYSLTPEELKIIVEGALKDEDRGLGKDKIAMDPKALDFLINSSNGDARIALNAVEIASKLSKNIKVEIIEEALQHKALRYDRAAEEHYNTISAFIKSMRGSDPDAALYWLARMIEAGEDPLFIARRMVIFASEDIGNADPHALTLAVSCFQAVNFVGLPEAQINLAHAATYLASAVKSNASYQGLLKAKRDVVETLNEPVPLNLRNAVTELMRELGYGKEYKYPHEYPGRFVKEDYLPPELKGSIYYEPSEEGTEKNIKERLRQLRK
jgi:putative ATPase